MKIIDAQIHLWRCNSSTEPWTDELSQYAHGLALSAEQILTVMDKTNIAFAILIPPSWIGDTNQTVLSAAQTYPDRFAVMGRFNPQLPDAKEQLSHWFDQPSMVGIRLTFHQGLWHKWLTDGSLDWFWTEAERLNIPLMIYVPGQLASVERIATRHPNLTLIIDHCGCRGGLKDAAAFVDLNELLALACYENIAVKATSLPSYTSDTYPFLSLHSYIRKIYDAFGSQRILWGSDYSRLPVPYHESVRLFTEAMDFLSPVDLEWIMGGTVSKLLRLIKS